mgnify:CR=1 FL=1
MRDVTVSCVSADGRDGHFISQCRQRHSHTELLTFLREINRETPMAKALNLIANNFATHKLSVLQDWLTKHPLRNALRPDIGARG